MRFEIDFQRITHIIIVYLKYILFTKSFRLIFQIIWVHNTYTVDTMIS